MECISGKGIFQGIAVGRIAIYHKAKQKIGKSQVTDPVGEWQRYLEARKQVLTTLDELAGKARSRAGEKDARIFDAQGMLLMDEYYNQYVRDRIMVDGVNAEYAIAETRDHFAGVFEQMEDELFRSRGEDIRDVSEQVLAGLLGGCATETFEEPVILLAEELTPSQTIRLDKSRVLAFVTTYGSAYSHASILARAMNIPALTGIAPREEWNGKIGAVDGGEGKLYLEPDEQTLALLREKKQKQEEQQKLLKKYVGKKTVTPSGKRILLGANIGGEEDLQSALDQDAEGIGLFRTEFLYLGRNDYPDEEEQFGVYKRVLEAMKGKRVIIRTLDLGADKQADYLELDKEENPAMGYRAIRLCLHRKEMFKTQLRAILRAATYGKAAVMFPMIISAGEVQEAKRLLQEAGEELKALGKAAGQPEIGVMIETPAAALISDELAAEVDFFSIGTNDLTQYTLAIDRQNAKLDGLYRKDHRAVMELIGMTIRNAHKAGIWVGICGEMAADLTLTSKWVSMGVDELSVTPGMILPVRQAVMTAED